ncbi:hypothetical protein V6N12_000427 [Hibiscus sabdariffa]|uniref:Endonuclease/exonuclease/phosphatase domain-containing protein n=1 Tax=Hibiscus sabdariffa TaxID=183260 RepID=A0ABR2BK22_9ROSI
MSIVAWNVRELGNADTVRALKDIVFKYKLNIVFLSETKNKKKYLEKIRTKMKLSESHHLELKGIAGSFALWWSKETQVTILKENKNLIDTCISINGDNEWFCTFIYGPPYLEEKEDFLGKAF